MTLDDLIAWQSGNYKARVRLKPGVSQDLVPVLASKLSGVRAVAPEVDHYDDASGFRITATGTDSDGVDIYEIGSPPPGVSRLSGYDSLEKAMAEMGAWSARKPVDKVEPSVHRQLSQPLREKLLASMGEAPVFDRRGSARRGLESGAIAGALASLAGGDGLAVGSALRGASRGVDRAFAGRYQDDVNQWRSRVNRDDRAVRLDDTRTAAMNKAGEAEFGQTRDAARLKLNQWEAEGRGLQNAFQSAVAELKAQQVDAREAGDKEEREAKRAEIKEKALRSANHDTIGVIHSLIRNPRLSPDSARELYDRIGVINEASARGEAAPDWVYELGPDAISLLSPAQEEQIRLRDEALKQGGVRLGIQKSNAETASKNAETSRLSYQERGRHNRKMEARPPGGARGAVDPIAGPKAGPAEQYAYQVRNHDQLLIQKQEIMPRLNALTETARLRRLTDEEYLEKQDLQASADTLGRYLQSVTGKLAALESQYPQLRDNYKRAVGDRNQAGQYRGSTMNKPSGTSGGSSKKASPKKASPKKAGVSYEIVPGVGRVKVER